jgi:hypothetical protein
MDLSFMPVNILFNANHLDLMHVLQRYEDDNGGSNDVGGRIGATLPLRPDLLDAGVTDTTKRPSNVLVIEDNASEEVP